MLKWGESRDKIKRTVQKIAKSRVMVHNVPLHEFEKAVYFGVYSSFQKLVFHDLCAEYL
jgi:hypothetical protein